MNTDLIENYAGVFEGLKNQPHNTVDDVRRTASRMAAAPTCSCAAPTWSSRRPTRWSVVWDENSPYKGKVTAYDSPIYIADAAVYLMATQPDLEIENPYELDDKQFQAAVDLLKKQRKNIGEYWSDYTKQIAAFTGGNSVVGTTWQVSQRAREREGAGRDDAAEGGLHRLVGHLDDLVQGQAPELHVPVDGPHHLAEGERELRPSTSARRRPARRRAR